MSHDLPPTSPAPSPSAPVSPQAAAEALFQQGVSAHNSGDLEQAARLYGLVLKEMPAHTLALNNLAVALRRLHRKPAADALYLRAMALSPETPNLTALVNRGNVLRDLGRYQDACASYYQALAHDSDCRGAWYGLGLVLRDMKKIDDSIAALEKTLSFTPDDPEVQWDLSHSLLCKGDLLRGFALYESRWRLKGVQRPRYPWPEWDGTAALTGKTLLLYGEQGFGDVLQCLRFIPLVAARGAKVVLHVRPELVSLLAGQFPAVTQIIVRDATPPAGCCDLVAPLMSLPWLLGLRREDIPRAPYITPPSIPVRLPQQAAQAALRIGLCWQGSPTHKNDHNRSMPFQHLVSLLRFPQVALFSLQKGKAASEPADWTIASMITILDPLLKSFRETAAVIAHLDLVIAVDTSVMHLAAAMGKPVWLLLPVSHDWRVDANDSLQTWYPSVRVFKQPSHGDWAGVMAQVETALERAIQHKTF